MRWSGAAFALAVTPVAEAGSSSSQPTRLVTFVARTCPSYADIAANRARNNIQESLQDLGADTLYNAGDAVSPAIEQAQQPNCTPLPDWRFTMGKGYASRAVERTLGRAVGRHRPVRGRHRRRSRASRCSTATATTPGRRSRAP